MLDSSPVVRVYRCVVLGAGDEELLLPLQLGYPGLRQKELWRVFCHFDQGYQKPLLTFVACVLLLWLFSLVVTLPPELSVPAFAFGWKGLFLAGVCLMQLCVGTALETRHDKTMARCWPWLIWYPVIYWTVNCLVTVLALPKAVLKDKSALAVWDSPDRGI